MLLLERLVPSITFCRVCQARRWPGRGQGLCHGDEASLVVVTLRDPKAQVPIPVLDLQRLDLRGITGEVCGLLQQRAQGMDDRIPAQTCGQLDIAQDAFMTGTHALPPPAPCPALDPGKGCRLDGSKRLWLHQIAIGLAGLIWQVPLVFESL